MNRRRIAILAIPLIGLVAGLGCLGQAEHSYFDDLVDGSIDGRVDSPVSSSDGQVMGDDGSNPPDAPDTPDAPGTPGDAGALDAGLDGPREAEAGPVIEAGCGPTTTVANCGQCGAACDTTHGTPTSCTAGSCSYTCSPGFGDCQPTAPDLNGCETPLSTTTNCSNCGVACDTVHSTGPGCSGTSCTYSGCQAGWRDCNSAAPNADGCECSSPACCDGGACQPQHDNGLAQTFYDCTPLGQYNSALALKACTAYTGNASLCVQFPCSPTTAGPIFCSSNLTTQPCLCWSFGGTNVGLFDNGGPKNNQGKFACFCPSAAAGDTPWQ